MMSHHTNSDDNDIKVYYVIR